jgi:multimeric flavodoxin WrbA
MTKILGTVGSMRKNEHTHKLVHHVIEDMKRLEPGIESELIHLADQDVHACKVVCSEFCSSLAYQCSTKDDVPAILNQMISADALIIATPLYFRAPPARFQAMIERLISIFFFYESKGGSKASPLQDKPCGLIGVAEYSNPHQMLEFLHDFCSVLKMRPVTLNHFPYLGVACQGDLQKDTFFNPLERSKELASTLAQAYKNQSNY